MWDSGFISIPYDFSISELPAMVRMLQAGQRPGDMSPEERAAAVAKASGSSNGAGAAAGNGASPSQVRRYVCVGLRIRMERAACVSV